MNLDLKKNTANNSVSLVCEKSDKSQIINMEEVKINTLIPEFEYNNSKKETVRYSL